MADFPKLEPHRRQTGAGEFNHAAVPGIAGTSKRFVHPSPPLRQPLTLQYRLITLAQADLIRAHYNGQDCGHVPFRLPAIVWNGRTSEANTTAWRYVQQPDEEELPGQRRNVTVRLEAVPDVVARTTTDP